MSAIKPERIARLRSRLLEERLTIEKRIAARESDLMDTVRDEEGVGDSDDEGQRLYDREDDLVSNELDLEHLEQVKKALGRMDAGTYGVSEVSGREIPIDRLEALPSATTLSGEDAS